jgi:subtilisin family serine protease
MVTRASLPKDPTGREDEDVVGWVFSTRLYDGATRRVTATRLPREAFGEAEPERKRVREPAPQAARDPVHPLLRRWLDERDPADQEELLVVTRETVPIPRFPEPALDEPRDSGRNRELLARSQRLVDEIAQRRAQGGRALAERVAAVGGKVLEEFWLISGAVVTMPLDGVRRLADSEDVISIEPRHTGEEPPQDDVADARSRIDSDPYFDLGQTGGWIGLLDTGARFTHTLLSNPSNVDFRRDCVNGGADCNTGTGLDPNDTSWNHGTCSAAILVGNSNQGEDYRGVTGITLDSWQIYTGAGLDVAAAIRGFQRAVAVLDRVIVAEIQGRGDHLSALAQAADAAFDAGAVVIAANGNFGPNASTVRCPANAHRVIGVGDVDVQTLDQIDSQGRGPTADSRFKPDIQAPTNTETASNASDTARKVFTGTSGATPYAAGAAALLRNWLRGGSGSIDPGQVYAQLILSGQDPYPFDNTVGAGLVRLPTNGWARWGKVAVADKATIDIPFSVTSGTAHTLDAALWWPEWGVRVLFVELDPHNDIDLAIVDPAGSVRASSISVNSVFERARVAGPISKGTWTIRVTGFMVPTGPQTVYWATHVRL